MLVDIHTYMYIRTTYMHTYVYGSTCIKDGLGHEEALRCASLLKYHSISVSFCLSIAKLRRYVSFHW